MTTYKFTLQTLTPLHIGNGEELRKDFDYAVANGGTWRLNADRILGTRYQPGRSFLPGKLLGADDFKNKDFFRYAVRGEPRSSITDARIKACIKDVYDCPYVPGSSIKGAIRTVLAKRVISDSNLKLNPLIDMTSTSRYSLKSKDDKIERKIFGTGADSLPRDFPREDIFRTLHVSDAMMTLENRKAGAGMEIINATPISRKPSVTGASVPIEMESIQRQQVFEGTITFDDFLLNGKFSDRAGMFGNWIRTLRDAGYERLEWLIDWFKGVDGSEMVDKNLAAMLTLKERFGDHPHALIQIGGGTGWDGVTYGELLQDENPYQFEKLIIDLKILRSTRRGSQNREMGELFPSSKKVVQDPKSGMKGKSLMGWCLLFFEKVER